MLRQEIERRLGAFAPTLAAETAGADGDFGLDDVPAGALRGAFRIQEHHDAVFLIGHQELIADGNRRRRGTDGNQNAA